MTNYQIARQLWNVDTDCEELWKDYFSKRYGSAAGTMRSFYEQLEKINFNEIKSHLAGKLRKSEKNLFPTSHLRYDNREGLKSEGPSWLENLQYAKSCRDLIDKALTAKVSDNVKARIIEDEGAFIYGETTLKYYDACVRAFRSERAGNRAVSYTHLTLPTNREV